MKDKDPFILHSQHCGYWWLAYARNQCISNNGRFSNSGIVWFQQQILVLLGVSATDEFTTIDSSPPGQNGRHFADDIFKCIFMNEKFCILIRISLKFVPKGPIDCKLALVQEMAWHRIGDKPLSEPKLHWSIYGTRGRLVKRPYSIHWCISSILSNISWFHWGI